jgi:hypothetical protein
MKWTADKLLEVSSNRRTLWKKSRNILLRDDSFASDAAGNGDCCCIGETLDKFAKAIDAVIDFDRTFSAKKTRTMIPTMRKKSLSLMP